jgi:NAD(P)-dependent dehydrogenase (short-subunit alcohol dehydrogenase family)
MAANDNNNNRIALITGANKGIGFEVARQLSQMGIHVLLGSRDESRGKKAVEQLLSENLPVSLIQIDVTNQSTIDAAVTEITNKYGHLDILINNSGVYGNEPHPSQLTLDTIRKNFEVNFFGAFSVTKSFLPLIKKSSSGRIVNVSSGLGSFYFHETNKPNYFHLAYSASKASLNMLTLQLAQELKNTNIKVNSCTPGLTATTLTNFHGHPVEIGAKSTVFLATLPDDGPSGKYFNENCQEDKW